jgi:adenylylsulfate kinase
MKALTVWFTGLSGAGKTTLSLLVHTELVMRGIPADYLDADEMRRNLTRDLGFSKEDREENIRRIGYVARLLTKNGIIALVAAISPYRSMREEVRALCGNGFMEVFVDAPLTVCEDRDPKGLYRAARAGGIHHFTGIDDPYEPPLSPDLVCHTYKESPMESREKVVSAILRRLETP